MGALGTACALHPWDFSVCRKGNGVLKEQPTQHELSACTTPLFGQQIQLQSFCARVRKSCRQSCVPRQAALGLGKPLKYESPHLADVHAVQSALSRIPSKRLARLICHGLKMEDKYPRRRRSQEEEELEEIRRERKGKQRTRSGRQGPEGAWRQEWWRPRQEEASSDDERHESQGANTSADPLTTYGSQFTKEGRRRRLVVDTADFAQVVIDRAGAVPVAPKTAEFDIRPLNAEVEKRMMWFLESIGIDFVDPSEVPGLPEDQEMKLEYLKALGLEEHELRDIISRWPQLLRCSLQRNVKPVVEYLSSYWVGLRGEVLREFLYKYPQVLYMSCEKDIMPVLDWLRGVGLERVEIKNALRKCPQLLEGSIDGTMSGCVAYLVSLGVPLAEVKTVLARCPQLFLSSVREVVKPRVDSLRSTLELADKDLVALIMSAPHVLLGKEEDQKEAKPLDKLELLNLAE